MAKDFYKNIVEKLSGYCWNTMTVDELADVLKRDMPKLISILQSKCESKNFNGTEAKSMAKKLRAVLAGADVIEMPSKLDCVNAADEHLELCNEECFPYEKEDEARAAFLNGVKWLESKIIK